MRKKFNTSGLGNDVTITYHSWYNNLESGSLDSTVTFKQMTLQGVIDTIYDFSYNKRKIEDDRKFPHYFVFLNGAERIYYRRRQIPMM